MSFPVNRNKRTNDEIGKIPNLEQKKPKETSFIVWDHIEKKEEKVEFVKEWFNDILEFNLETPRKLETKDFNKIKSSENLKFTELRQPNDKEMDIDSNKENQDEDDKSDNESERSDSTPVYERIEKPMKRDDERDNESDQSDSQSEHSDSTMDLFDKQIAFLARLKLDDKIIEKNPDDIEKNF